MRISADTGIVCVFRKNEDGTEIEEKCSTCEGTGKIKRPPSRKAWEGDEKSDDGTNEKEKRQKKKREPLPIDPEAGDPLSYDPNFKGRN